MGEYAKLNGKDIKIGTCEDMFYLRADQVHLITPERGSVNPKMQPEHIRFRFPFPNEDHIEPGAFEDFDKGLGLFGLEPPADIDHGFLQMTRNYPHSGGILLSVPCPESKEGKASGLKFHYNGYSGKVLISQQRLVDSKLVLVCACGSCGAKWRCPTLEDAQPVIDACLAKKEKFWTEIANRIAAGYTEPNYWTQFQPA